MPSLDLKSMLEQQSGSLQTINKSLLANDEETLIAGLAGLFTSVLTGVPGLAPIAESAISAAFGRSATAMLRKELATMERDEQRRAFVGQLIDPLEDLIGQALIQIVRSQTRIADDLLSRLGGLRQDLEEFREDFASRASKAIVKLDIQAVVGGATGIRVRHSGNANVTVGRQHIEGAGSTGVDVE
jgi:hypothetical protein